MGIEDTLEKANIVLLDIEGTTTSISYVKETLFGFIRSNLEHYVKTHWNDAEFQEDLVVLKQQAHKDKINKVEGLIEIPDGSIAAVVKNVLWQMDLDRKTKALKQLQGHIMHEGYNNGELKGHMYPDVLPALKSWVSKGKKLYIYSSGSIEAQKLLFGHSEEGNILELFSGHFDTAVGGKTDTASYMNISNELNCRCQDVLFLTDVPKEARAAKSAGMEAVLVVREGNAPLSEEDKVSFSVISSFPMLSC
ncbi:hypothetical protein L9F63_020637 [Diploptera punctata]|uniref:Enolase-phosphatase E1 n=1 Tax=Diploptera punctata TaxID=6984 RepID=A0AAD8ECS2_DIPPU|nr:hypothetical protein L9F63_020637 [Diploptera punctata]